jgi:hypothetical protein
MDGVDVWMHGEEEHRAEGKDNDFGDDDFGDDDFKEETDIVKGK